MSAVLVPIAWGIVAGILAVAAAYLFLAWRLWRQERREQPETGWRLRRRGPDHANPAVRTESRAGKRADQRSAGEP